LAKKISTTAMTAIERSMRRRPPQAKTKDPYRMPVGVISSSHRRSGCGEPHRQRRRAGLLSPAVDDGQVTDHRPDGGRAVLGDRRDARGQMPCLIPRGGPDGEDGREEE